MGDLEYMPNPGTAEGAEVMDEGKRAEVEAARQELEAKVNAFFSHLKVAQESGLLEEQPGQPPLYDSEIEQEYLSLCGEILERARAVRPEAYAEFYCDIRYGKIREISQKQGTDLLLAKIEESERKRLKEVKESEKPEESR